MSISRMRMSVGCDWKGRGNVLTQPTKLTACTLAMDEPGLWATNASFACLYSILGG